MSYDIGIGRCVQIDPTAVTVQIESAMLRRLAPQHPWQRSGITLLRLNRSICSLARPPEVGRELYLSRSALTKASKAELDLRGDGDFVAVDVRSLLVGLDPQPAAAVSAPKYRAANYRTSHG